MNVKTFVSKDQELQFFCKKYGELLKIKDLYSFYKKHIWFIKKANQLSDKIKDAKISEFKAGILQIETGADKYLLLLDLFNKIN